MLIRAEMLPWFARAAVKRLRSEPELDLDERGAMLIEQHSRAFLAQGSRRVVCESTRVPAGGFGEARLRAVRREVLPGRVDVDPDSPVLLPPSGFPPASPRGDRPLRVLRRGSEASCRRCSPGRTATTDSASIELARGPSGSTARLLTSPKKFS